MINLRKWDIKRAHGSAEEDGGKIKWVSRGSKENGAKSWRACRGSEKNGGTVK